MISTLIFLFQIAFLSWKEMILEEVRRDARSIGVFGDLEFRKTIKACRGHLLEPALESRLGGFRVINIGEIILLQSLQKGIDLTLEF